MADDSANSDAFPWPQLDVGLRRRSGTGPVAAATPVQDNIMTAGQPVSPAPSIAETEILRHGAQERGASICRVHGQNLPDDVSEPGNTVINTLLGRDDDKAQWRPKTLSVEDEDAAARASVTGDTPAMAAALQQLARALKDFHTDTKTEGPDFLFEGKITEDPNTYLNKLKTYIAANHVPMHRVAAIIKRTLGGEAARWWSSANYQDIDLLVFESHFKARFDSIAIRTGLLKQLYGRTQSDNEAVHAFILQKWALFSRVAGETPNEIRLCVIQELLSVQIRPFTRMRKFNTLQEMLEVAGQLEIDLAERSRSRRTEPDLNRGQTNNSAAGANRQAPNEPPYPCRMCGAMHFMRDCPQRGTNAPGPSRMDNQRPPAAGNTGNAPGAAATTNARPNQPR